MIFRQKSEESVFGGKTFLETHNSLHRNPLFNLLVTQRSVEWQFRASEKMLSSELGEYQEAD